MCDTIAAMTPLDDMTDSELACQLGVSGSQAEAFRLLYDRHALALVAFARSRFRQLAEDLCQNAWVQALKHEWTPTENIRAWLFRVVRNAGVSELRRSRATSLDTGAELMGSSDDPSVGLLHEERLRRLRLCHEKLLKQKPDWHAVVQAFLDGESPVAASERLGISRANFDQRKSRALDALANCAGSESRGTD